MENRAPVLSIVIPVYNVEQYLRQCLDSILAQDCPEGFDYEVLLVDDGSTDQSGILCDEYAARYPQVRVFHRENGGQSAARNQAIRAARGEWLAFVDSDDYVMDSFLSRLAEHLWDELDLVVYNSYSTRDNAIRAPFLKSQFEGGVSSYLARAIREHPFVAAPWRYAIRHRFLMEHALWFHEGIYHEDCEWCPKVLVYAEKLDVCEQPLYVYRDAVEAGHESTCLSPERWKKRLTGLGAVVEALCEESDRFEKDAVRQTFLLRSAALAQMQRLKLALKADRLSEIVGQEKKRRKLTAYMPKRFALCVKLAGLQGGTKVYSKIWGEG